MGFVGGSSTNRKLSSVDGGISPYKFECIGRRRSAWCTKAELSDQADSETPRRLPHADYVLHRTGCAQEDDQLLREGWQWHDARRRYDPGHTFGPGPLDENIAAAVDRGDGSHGFYRVDLRLLAATCRSTESCPSADAAGHCGGGKEERSH